LIQGGANLPPEVETARAAAAERERLPENQVEVVPEPETLHPAVVKTEKKLRSASRGNKGLTVVSSVDAFALEIGSESVKRVIVFLNALAGAAQDRGFSIARGEKSLKFVVEGEAIDFKIVESVTRSKHEPTDAELAAMKKWERRQEQSRYTWDRNWTPPPTPPEWDYTPNGYLSVMLNDGRYGYDKIRKAFKDGKSQRIENSINGILEALTTWSAAIKAKRVEDARRTQEWEEAERRRKERERLAALESKRIEVIDRDLGRRRKHLEVLEYVAAVRGRLEAAAYEDPEAIREWVAWAERKTDAPSARVRGSINGSWPVAAIDSKTTAKGTAGRCCRRSQNGRCAGNPPYPGVARKQLCGRCSPRRRTVEGEVLLLPFSSRAGDHGQTVEWTEVLRHRPEGRSMKPRLRCAIYTRKSTEEGLEQEFNSLDAQREAGEAFVQSQKQEGWSLIESRYDDGAFSGGNLNRPALQQMLTEIREGRVDVVVVYKVDRLTRSLADFAKMVELFDKHSVSFVSVTQAFNTTSSMGRLTLNVLLSFAQFEREVTAERIRDKITASKKKGMWMGGPVPLGYDVKDRKLIINEAEAEQIRTVFDLYLRLDNVRELKAELDRLNIRTKTQAYRSGKQVGDCAFTRGRLYHLLKNPLYIGKITHKGEVYDGEHQGIIDEIKWETVQEKLAGRSNRLPNTSAPSQSLLAGIIFDHQGRRLTPNHAVKKGKRYRYYISADLNGKRTAGDGWRLPAKCIEDIVLNAVLRLLRDPRRLMDAIDPIESELADMNALCEFSGDNPATLATHSVIKAVHHVAVLSDELRIDVDVAALRMLCHLRPAAKVQKVYSLNLPTKFKRRGVETKIILESSQTGDVHKSANLVRLVARSFRWFDNLKSGQVLSLEEIARAEGMSASDVSRYLPLAFLAPDIVESIANGRQPIELTVERIKKLSPLPSHWEEQRRILGYAA